MYLHIVPFVTVFTYMSEPTYSLIVKCSYLHIYLQLLSYLICCIPAQSVCTGVVTLCGYSQLHTLIAKQQIFHHAYLVSHDCLATYIASLLWPFFGDYHSNIVCHSQFSLTGWSTMLAYLRPSMPSSLQFIIPSSTCYGFMLIYSPLWLLRALLLTQSSVHMYLVIYAYLVFYVLQSSSLHCLLCLWPSVHIYLQYVYLICSTCLSTLLCLNTLQSILICSPL